MDVFNFSENKWVERFEAPKEMGNSHLGVASDDGRYVYVVSGQYGPQCRGPTARAFVLDTRTKRWNDMPSLPSPRFITCLVCLSKKVGKKRESNIFLVTCDISYLSFNFFFFFCC